MRIAIVCGEASGDQLAVGLMQAMLRHDPGLCFEGVAGPLMQQAGCRLLFPADRLAVMGLTEVIKQLPALLRIRRSLWRHWQQQPPDLLITIDSPDFCLPLARRMRRWGIPVLHYVSPSLWAWRSGRIHTLKAAVDHQLVLFPFEALPYQRAAIPVTVVGHPMAQRLRPLRADCCKTVGSTPHLALFPGSRYNEVARLLPDFLAAADVCRKAIPGLKVTLSLMPTAQAQQQAAALLRQAGAGAWCAIQAGNPHQLMQWADSLLIASGTATLEAMLINRPMVVAYRTSGLSWAMLSRLVRTPHIALPNILAGERLVPELLQQQARPESLAREIKHSLQDAAWRQHLYQRFKSLGDALDQESDEKAAAVAFGMLKKAD